MMSSAQGLANKMNFQLIVVTILRDWLAISKEAFQCVLGQLKGL